MGEHTNHPDNFSFEEDIHRDGRLSKLILHNDDIHSFDYVIDALVKVCEHDILQAEQCAYITHYKGKCDVKRGEANKLASFRYQLIDKGLRVTID